MSEAPRKRGRPVGIARQIADETGLSLRTVQRVLAADRPSEVETDDDKILRRFMETFRNFASFCRENSCDRVASLTITEGQADKLREWNAIVLPWLRRLNSEDPPEPGGPAS